MLQLSIKKRTTITRLFTFFLNGLVRQFSSHCFVANLSISFNKEDMIERVMTKKSIPNNVVK